MKKTYIEPEVSLFEVSFASLLAGSLNADDQSDPTMAPMFNDDFDSAPGFDEF